MEKTNNKPVPKETVLERPDLIFGIETGNVGLRKGEGGVYVKIQSCLHPRHRVGEFVSYCEVENSQHIVQYTGPIDDEMMANILIYGG